VSTLRRHWWGLLAARPQGFPWLRVAGREPGGITVVDLDASGVFASSDKDNAQPITSGGIGFCPNLATCDTPMTWWRSTHDPALRPPTAPPRT